MSYNPNFNQSTKVIDYTKIEGLIQNPLINSIDQYVSINSSPTFNVIKCGSGTMANPSITFSSDSNSGFYNSADGVIDVSLNGNRVGKLDYANNNISLGVSAALNNSGKHNIAIGSNALSSTTSDYNIGIGIDAAKNITSGLSNLSIGQSSASTLTTGNNNILIGSASNVATSNSEYSVAIGNGVTARTNEIVIGQSTNYTNGISLAVNTGIGKAAGTDMLEVNGTARASNFMTTGYYASHKYQHSHTTGSTSTFIITTVGVIADGFYQYILRSELDNTINSFGIVRISSTAGLPLISLILNSGTYITTYSISTTEISITFSAAVATQTIQLSLLRML